MEDANGGEAGIRTLGGDKPSTVFKTAAFGRSATSPLRALYTGFFVASNHFKDKNILIVFCATYMINSSKIYINPMREIVNLHKRIL